MKFWSDFKGTDWYKFDIGRGWIIIPEYIRNEDYFLTKNPEYERRAL